MINKNIKLIDIPNVLNSFLSDVECSGLSFDRRMTPLKSKLELKTYVDENDKYYQIELVVPSFSKNDISILADESNLNIKSNIKDKSDGNRYNRYSFDKSFKIPANCNHLKISAKLENGVLQVILPKKKIPKPRTIKVS